MLDKQARVSWLIHVVFGCFIHHSLYRVVVSLCVFVDSQTSSSSSSSSKVIRLATRHEEERDDKVVRIELSWIDTDTY